MKFTISMCTIHALQNIPKGAQLSPLPKFRISSSSLCLLTAAFYLWSILNEFLFMVWGRGPNLFCMWLSSYPGTICWWNDAFPKNFVCYHPLLKCLLFCNLKTPRCTVEFSWGYYMWYHSIFNDKVALKTHLSVQSGIKDICKSIKQCYFSHYYYHVQRFVYLFER